jgi:hypothetical protein
MPRDAIWRKVKVLGSRLMPNSVFSESKGFIPVGVARFWDSGYGYLTLAGQRLLTARLLAK